MKSIFLVYELFIVVLFAYATHTGWNLWDMVKSGTWGPRGHSVNHK